MLANSSWAWGLPWLTVDVPSKTPLEKIAFPFSAALLHQPS